MRREEVFSGVVIATLVLLFLSSPLALLWLGWFLGAGTDQISHRVHEVVFGTLFAVVFVGLIAQLRHPARNVAGMQQAVLTVVVLAAVEVLASGSADPLLLIYLLPVILLVVLHPARGQLVRPPLRPSGRLIVLGTVAVPALLVMAFDELDLASRHVGGHVEHWGAMAAFALTLIGLVLIAGLRPPGSRVSAWSAGGAMAIYAATSVGYPDDASSAVLRTDLWVGLSLAWSVLFVTVAERSRVQPETSPAPEPPAPGPPAGRPRRVAGFLGRSVLIGLTGLVLLVVALLWSFTDTPRIPHQVTERERVHCASCHFAGVNATTGEANVPQIDPREHPAAGSTPANCVNCHDEGGFLDVEGAMIVQMDRGRPGTGPLTAPDGAEIDALRSYEQGRGQR